MRYLLPFLVFFLGLQFSFGQTTFCDSVWTDAGGPDGDYLLGNSFVDTLHASPGNALQLVFTELQLAEFDTLFVFDPVFPDVNALTLVSNSPLNSITSFGNSLIIVWSNQGSIPAAGWSAQASCTSNPFMSIDPNLDTLCVGFEGFVSWQLLAPLPADVQIVSVLSDASGSFANPTASGESLASDEQLYLQLGSELPESLSYLLRYTVNHPDYSDLVFEWPVQIFRFPEQPNIVADAVFCGDTALLRVDAQDRVDLQWYLLDLELIGETDTLLQITQAGIYRVDAINLCGNVSSSSVEIIQLQSPTIPQISSTSDVICPNDTLELNVVIGLQEAELHWLKDGITQPETDTLLNINAAGAYHVTLSNACGIVSSDTILISALNFPPASTIQSSGALEFCEGASVSLAVDSLPGISIQWLFNQQNLATSFDVQVNETGIYSCVLSNVCASVASLNQIELTVLPSPQVITITAAGPTTLCEGNSVLLVSNPANGDVVTWFKDGELQTNSDQISVTTSGLYTAQSANSCGTLPSANSIPVQINPLPQIPIVFTTGNPALCNGSEVNLFVNQVDGITYTWKKNGSVYSSGPGSILVDQPGVYTLSASNSCGTVNAQSPVSVTAGTQPIIPTLNASGPMSFCEGNSVTIQTTPQNGNLFRWLLNGIQIPGNSFSIQATQSGTYSLEVSNACDTVLSSNSISVNVNPLPPVVEIFPFTEQNLCLGETIDLSIINLVGVSFQWKYNGDPIGLNQPLLTASLEGEYTIVLANTCGTTPSSTTVVVNVDSIAPVVQTIIPQPGTALCPGGYVLLNAQPVPFQTYNWYLNGEVILSQSNPVLQATEWGLYTVQSSNACGVSDISPSVELGPGDPPSDFNLYTTEGLSVCENDSIAITAQVAFGVGVQWFLNGTLIHDGPAQIYVDQAGNYTASAYNGCGQASGLNGVQIEQLPAPEIPVITISGSELICNSVGELQWYNSAQELIAGEVSSSFQPLPVNAAYYVSVTNDVGCTSFSLPYNYLINGLKTEETPVFWKIYPNPSSGTVFVEGEDLMDLILMDLVGKQIHVPHRFSGPTTCTLDVSSLRSGVYLIKSSNRLSRLIVD